MLSRRNTRIKVLQSLYAFDRDSELEFNEVKKSFHALTVDTFNLYLYALYTLVEFCKLALIDQKKRSEKYLPTEEDKNFQPILFENKAVQSIYLNEAFQIKCKREDFKNRISPGVIMRLYREYAATSEYKAYVYQDYHTDEEHILILHDIVRFLKSKESFNEMMDEGYVNWVDDESLVYGALKKTLKSLPVEESFFMDYYPSSETTRDFGEKLLVQVHERDKELEEEIKGVLENWDVERLAILDLLILKMGIGELLSFKNIPAQVTINEYVELAKMYSTGKSRIFINGVLDKIMRKLQENGTID